jgi:hypothetical protein
VGQLSRPAISRRGSFVSTEGKNRVTLKLTRRRVVAAGIVTAALAAAAVSQTGRAPSASAREAASPGLQQAFAKASDESGVPAPLLLALSYNLTRWDDHGSASSAAGGYGPLHLTDVDPDTVRDQAGKGDGGRINAAAIAASPALHRLDAAAKLVGSGSEQLKTDDVLNVRAGAALLAEQARKLGGGNLPKDLAGWYPAVAWYSGSPQASGANAFADDVYDTVRAGAARTTNTGERVALPATAVTGSLKRATVSTTNPDVECPLGMNCRFIPAAYGWVNTADPNDYGNYDPANRPADGNKIRYIVIHDTERSYAQTIAAAQLPTSYVASHYVIRSSDGEVTQMLRTKDIGYHAGNWNINTESIGIEHEAVAREGASWYTEAMYKASARLVRYLAARYHIPLDRTHIIGHDDIERERAASVANAHWDPGPFWDWERYMALLGAPVATRSGAVQAGDVVTIVPDFATNRQALPSCSPAPCQDLPEQPTNFVYLRTEPRADAPLLTDPALQPAGQESLPNAEEWSNKAVAGRQYVVAEKGDGWVAIWYAGKKAWIADPEGTLVRLSLIARAITPAAGRDSIPVYGRAFPEANEYPAEIAPATGAPLQYTIPAGQRYVAGEVTQANNYYARFDAANVPLNHTLVMGQQKYLRISLNHRWAFVKVSDIEFLY